MTWKRNREILEDGLNKPRKERLAARPRTRAVLIKSPNVPDTEVGRPGHRNEYWYVERKINATSVSPHTKDHRRYEAVVQTVATLSSSECQHED